MRLIKLKPCPICGNKHKTIWKVVSRRWYEKKHFVECDYCHFCAKRAYTKRGAIRLWNKSTNVVCVKVGEEHASD